MAVGNVLSSEFSKPSSTQSCSSISISCTVHLAVVSLYGLYANCMFAVAQNLAGLQIFCSYWFRGLENVYSDSNEYFTGCMARLYYACEQCFYSSLAYKWKPNVM